MTGESYGLPIKSVYLEILNYNGSLVYSCHTLGPYSHNCGCTGSVEPGVIKINNRVHSLSITDRQRQPQRQPSKSVGITKLLIKPNLELT